MAVTRILWLLYAVVATVAGAFGALLLAALPGILRDVSDNVGGLGELAAAVTGTEVQAREPDAALEALVGLGGPAVMAVVVVAAWLGFATKRAGLSFGAGVLGAIAFAALWWGAPRLL